MGRFFRSVGLSVSLRDAFTFGAQSLVAPLHSAVAARLAAQDQDQEVKDAAITTSAATIAILGDLLSSQVPALLKVRSRSGM